MNYRHVYHAGSFSDVFKHFLLTLILQKLREKEAPFCVLDTHAGLGLYDLTSEAAGKTREFEGGIKKLLNCKNVDEVFDPYLKLVESLNPDPSRGLQFYPGSPCVAQHFLRPQDRLMLSELHPRDFQHLKENFRHDRRVKVFHQDAYISLKAWLPPLERRGLVLIDPPFEETNEIEMLLQGLKDATARFAHGIISIWFPIKDMPPIRKFYQNLKDLGIPKMLAVEFLIHPADTPERLNGCGMIIINPPWKLDVTLKSSLPKLLKYLDRDKEGKTRIHWLTGEAISQ